MSATVLSAGVAAENKSSALQVVSWECVCMCVRTCGCAHTCAYTCAWGVWELTVTKYTIKGITTVLN